MGGKLTFTGLGLYEISPCSLKGDRVQESGAEVRHVEFCRCRCVETGCRRSKGKGPGMRVN